MVNVEQYPTHVNESETGETSWHRSSWMRFLACRKLKSFARIRMPKISLPHLPTVHVFPIHLEKKLWQCHKAYIAAGYDGKLKVINYFLVFRLANFLRWNWLICAGIVCGQTKEPTEHHNCNHSSELR